MNIFTGQKILNSEAFMKVTLHLHNIFLSCSLQTVQYCTAMNTTTSPTEVDLNKRSIIIKKVLLLFVTNLQYQGPTTRAQ